MPPKNLSKDHIFQELTGGRSLQQQIDYIKKFGTHATPGALRRRELWGAGIRKPEGNAENVMYFGCYQLPRFNNSFRRFFRLLELLGIEHTFLDYEVCCGDPLAETTVGADREAALEVAKGFIRENVSAAQEVGGKSLVYFCIWCAYIANRLDPAGSVRHLYYPDILLDRLNSKSISIKPTTIGYYEGCHRRGKNIAPGVKLNLAGYREVLSNIKGLTVLDLNSRRCCVDVPSRIVDEALSLNAQTIVSVCNACEIRLRDVGQGKIQTQFYIDFLCDVFDIPKE